MNYDFDSMKDAMIDNGSYEKIDACVDSMMKTAYLCGLKMGMQQFLLSLYKNKCSLLFLPNDLPQPSRQDAGKEIDKKEKK